MDRSYYLGLTFQNLWRSVVRREDFTRLVWQMRYAPYFPNTSYGLKPTPATYADAGINYQPGLPYVKYEDQPLDPRTPHTYDRPVPIYEINKCQIPLNESDKWYNMAPAAHQKWYSICPRYRMAKVQPKEVAFSPTAELDHKSRLEAKPEQLIHTNRDVEFPMSGNAGNNKYQGTRDLYKNDLTPLSFNRQTYMATHPCTYDLI